MLTSGRGVRAITHCYRPSVSASDVTDAYLADLRLERQQPGLEALSAIMVRHIARYPFANIGVQLGEDLPLDLGSIYDRLVRRQRGGYCYDHNGLLIEVLAELGYDVRLQMARVLLTGSPHPPLTHRFTRVRLDGDEYIVDVGFGPNGPPFPVPMRTAGGNDSRYRVVAHGDVGFQFEERNQGGWLPLYRFDDVRCGDSDVVLGHFYSHRHPDAGFVRNLVASLILTNEVRSLRNHDYWVIRADGTTSEQVESPARLHEILTQELRIMVTSSESDRLFSGSDRRTASSTGRE